jgi:hypothetical protein
LIEVRSEASRYPESEHVPLAVRAVPALTDFKQLDPNTQHARRQVLEHTWAEPIAPGAKKTFAVFPISTMSTKAVRVLRDRKGGVPQAANARVKAIRRLFRWALDDEVPGLKGNPARDVSYLRRQGGFHSWTIDEVERYEQCHVSVLEPQSPSDHT